MSNEEDFMTENSYIELANQFKTIFDDKNKELNKNKQKFNKLYKNIIIVFGILSLSMKEITFDNFEIEALMWKASNLMENMLSDNRFYILEKY